MKHLLQRLTGDKGYAVFAVSAASADRIIRHLAAANANSSRPLPIWLLSRAAPSPELAAQCAAIVMEPNAWKLSARALGFLQGRWPALSAVCWTGEPGAGPLRWLPFLLPPFRVVILNRHGDFLSAQPLELLRNALLGFAAAVAPAVSPLLRFASRRFTRAVNARLVVPQTPALADLRDALVIEHRGRDWPHAVIEAALRQASQPWVIFREAGTQVNFAEVLPQLAAGDTFAVSAQLGLRGWRKLPLINAPFRSLQPGEVSRTLAPVSNCILADRAKVLALGVPRALTWGAAWYALFWKAAAAGWPAYSAGSGPCGQMPDFTLEEAEFLHHAFWDQPPMRRLVPVDEALSRGNIAFSPAAHRPFRPGLPRVLVVSPYLPFPLSHGGAVRIYNLCRALAGSVDFVLACFREQGETVAYGPLSEIFREIYVVDNDQIPQPGPEPRQVREYASIPMRELIGRLVADRQIEILQIEYTQLAAYRNAAPSLPAILVEHDITFTLYEQMAGQRNTAGARDEAARWRRFESERLAVFDTVWTMSEDDRRQALAAGARQTAVVPNGVDLERFRCAAGPDAPGQAPVLFYVGSFRHHPNLAGFEQLQNIILPLVWEKFPGARLVVVAGPQYEQYWRGPQPDPRIRIHGFVADLQPLYQEAAVVCVPLPISAGTNIKVMEAMACGRAVVSNAVGARGLDLTDGHDILIREIGPDFAAAVCRLLEDREYRERIGRAARLTSERRFGWQAIAGIAGQNYAALRAVSANQIYSE